MAPVRRLRVTDRATGVVILEVGDDAPGSAGDPPAAGDAPSIGDAPTAGDAPDAAAGGLLRSRGIAVSDIGDGGLEVVVDGWRFELDVEDAARADLRERATRRGSAPGLDGPIDVRAIIPGRIVSVAVGPGDAVTAGTRLMAVEAMKMENEVRAPRDGTVDRVAVAPGQTVDLGDLLVVLR